jgi:hypothetical protein
MAEEQQTPDTIVFIQGPWMRTQSWEKWIDRYSRRGYLLLGGRGGRCGRGERGERGRRGRCSRGCGARVPEVGEPAPRRQQDNREDEADAVRRSKVAEDVLTDDIRSIPSLRLAELARLSVRGVRLDSEGIW